MAHDVFISYASRDKAAADAVCEGLEQRSIRCWMAPRDIVPGVPWAESIIDAIEGSGVMLLLFSEASNKSVQVQREVERAVHKDVSLVPVRIENVMPTRTMEYFISSQHWFDAIQTPITQHMERLAQAVKAHLARRGSEGDLLPEADAAPSPPPPAPTVAAAPAAPAQPAPAASPAAPSASEPLIVGNYELTKVLATGRFGSIVYAGEHRLLGSPVAVRVYRPTEKDNKEAIRARFLREARALQVIHPNIIHVRDFGEQGDMMYVVTDLLAGVSLGGLVRTEGRLPLDKLNAFVRELSQATAAVHQHGGFISGLHPEIVRVVQENGGERLAISSAGIGGMQDLLATMDVSALRGQEAPSELSYVAPELLMGNAADQRADVFTIGALMYYMATGRPPYQAESFPQLLGRMLSTKPPEVGVERPDLGADAAATIMRCIASDATLRFTTAADVTQAWAAAVATATQ
ncbi:MAG TPA: TIR domain-containing protein [Vicinamibacterales bacterium]|nr:TIR domain-containing protein [Vicinamibacterales bacterium]